MSPTLETSYLDFPQGVWPEAPSTSFQRDAEQAWDQLPARRLRAAGRPEWERDLVMCLPAHWHNNQTFLPPLLAARIILLSLLEAGGPVLVTCPFLAGFRPFILGEC